MLNDYKLSGTIKRIEVEIETEVAEKLHRMEQYSQLSQSEIANTALKRFISTHKDFFPIHEQQPED